MKFEVIATEFFIEQIENLDEKSKEQVKDKIKLILANPFRFKRIHSKTVHYVFRVRLLCNLLFTPSSQELFFLRQHQHPKP